MYVYVLIRVDMYRNLDKGVKKQIKYYKNYVRSSEGAGGAGGSLQSIRLYGVVGSTEIDGRRDLHAALVGGSMACHVMHYTFTYNCVYIWACMCFYS